jgi:hypothetical protein
LFSGFEFFISNVEEIGSNVSKKTALEITIVENGGTKVQNYLPNTTTHVISSVLDCRTSNIIKKYDINIYSPKWIFDCVRHQKIINISPLYLKYVNSETSNIFKKTIDIYNDNFFEDVNKESLNEILDHMPKISNEQDFKEVLFDIKQEYSDNLLIKMLSNDCFII